VARAAQKEENWDKNLEIKTIGGKLTTLPKEEFNKWDE